MHDARDDQVSALTSRGEPRVEMYEDKGTEACCAAKDRSREEMFELPPSEVEGEGGINDDGTLCGGGGIDCSGSELAAEKSASVAVTMTG